MYSDCRHLGQLGIQIQLFKFWNIWFSDFETHHPKSIFNHLYFVRFEKELQGLNVVL